MPRCFTLHAEVFLGKTLNPELLLMIHWCLCEWAVLYKVTWVEKHNIVTSSSNFRLYSTRSQLQLPQSQSVQHSLQSTTSTCIHLAVPWSEKLFSCMGTDLWQQTVTLHPVLGFFGTYPYRLGNLQSSWVFWWVLSISMNANNFVPESLNFATDQIKHRRNLKCKSHFSLFFNLEGKPCHF